MTLAASFKTYTLIPPEFCARAAGVDELDVGVDSGGGGVPVNQVVNGTICHFGGSGSRVRD
jgi:hypothetical protein